MSDSTTPIFADVTEALNAYNSNLDWDSTPEKARVALNAVRFLLTNRPAASTLSGISLSFADLSQEKTKIEVYLQAQKRLSWTVGRAYR